MCLITLDMLLMCYFFIENGKRDEILNHLNNKGLPAMVGSYLKFTEKKHFLN